MASPFCTTEDGKPGVTIDWYAGDDFKGSPVVTQRRANTDLFLWDSAPLEHVGPEWSAVATTYLTPTTTGKHTISFMSVGPGELYLDDKLALDLWDWSEEGEAMFDGSIDHLVEADMEAGKTVKLCVRMTNELRPFSKQKQLNMTHKYGGCRIGFMEDDKVEYLQEAVEAAKLVDVAVVIVGLDAEWESEGYDRQTMPLWSCLPMSVKIVLSRQCSRRIRKQWWSTSLAHLSRCPGLTGCLLSSRHGIRTGGG